MIVSILFGVLQGRGVQVTEAVFSGASSAISLCISLCGTIAFFSGLMKVAEKGGVTKVISRILRPFFKLLFKGLDPDGKAAQAICMNVSANMLGLGNAATPFGLQAMTHLQEDNIDKNVASNHMITFVVLNTASLQLIPTTIAVLRTKYGSKSPMDIMVAVWIASISSLVTGLVMAGLLNSSNKKPRRLRR